MNEKKGDATNIALDNLEHAFTMMNPTTIQNNFQYECSFCWRTLPDNGLRFAGFGVCPPHLKLAETIVDLLRGHEANYSTRFGGAK